MNSLTPSTGTRRITQTQAALLVTAAVAVLLGFVLREPRYGGRTMAA